MPLVWTLVGLAGFAISTFLGAMVVFVRRCPRPLGHAPEQDRDRAAALLSIVIPARNEAAMLEGCVRSALAQDYPNLEVVVVDDASDDGTGEIAARLAAEDPRCRVVAGRPLSAGWLGKPNAVDHGVQHASGDFLLFIDADVRLAPEAATAAMEEMRRRGLAFLSLWPYHTLEGPMTSLVQSVMVSLALFADVMQRVGGRPFPVALGAWGPFILVNAADYRDVGGHAAVRSSVNEDHVLGRNFRKAGKATAMLDGTRLVSVTMYWRLAQLWRGWSKNLHANLRSSHLLTLGAALLALFVTSGPTAAFVLAAVEGSAPGMAVAGALLVMQAAVGALATRHVRILPLLALSPIGGVVAAALYLASSLNAATGRAVTWKGRALPVD
ncbi:MAG TPA: glycosyltransferase [Longimicrobiales bacterium]|nr:glycosyltransferase [Trueperaceae bacterium]HKJ92097.1 glycosyltransferase [Longimicrobiales bacterium]